MKNEKIKIVTVADYYDKLYQLTNIGRSLTAAIDLTCNGERYEVTLSAFDRKRTEEAVRRDWLAKGYEV